MTGSGGKSRATALRARLVGMLRGPTLIYLFASGLARLGAIVLIPLYTRKLSPSTYGDYALAQTLIAVLPTFMSLGLLSAIPKAYFDEKDRDRGTEAAGAVSAWVVATVASSMVALFTAVSAAPDIGFGGRWEMSCILVAAAGGALTTIPTTYLRSAQRPFAAATWQLCEFALVAGCGGILVGVFERGLRGAIEAIALAYAIMGTFGLGFVLFFLRGRLRRGTLGRALAFSLPFVPHFLANWSQLAADRWVMKLFGREGELGPYVLATQLVSPIAMVVAAFHDGEAARMGEFFRDGSIAGLRAQFGKIQRRYLLAAVVPSVLVLCAIPLLPYLLGRSFHSSLGLMPLVMGLTIVDTMYFPSSIVVYFAGRTRLIPVVTVASALVNVGANLVLIPRLGVLGAVVSKAISYALRSGAMWVAGQWCFRKAGSSTDAAVAPETASAEATVTRDSA